MRTFGELLNSQNRLSRKEMAGIGGGDHYIKVKCTDGMELSGYIAEDKSDDELRQWAYEVCYKGRHGDWESAIVC